MTTWTECTKKIVERFELAARLGMPCEFNATGSEAMAKLIREMARLLDAQCGAAPRPKIDMSKHGPDYDFG